MERSDVVLAVVPLLALSGPVVAGAARALEALTGVGGGVARLPFTPLGLLAALGVITAAMFLLPTGRR